MRQMLKYPTGLCAGIGVTLIALTAGAEAARRPQSRPASNGPELPAIRIAANNRVPACVTPERLMLFLTQRNDALETKFRTIAHDYKRFGDANGVRWDLAFIQMALETNFLKFRRGDGKPGDVRSAQNNFAGIGATGGGVPGERFADVPTGVKAHIQHLVAYSGEMVADPVAKRTREVQDGVVATSLKLGRTVRFDDLTKRWAADRNYARSMDVLSTKFREDFCTGAAAQVAEAPAAKASPAVTPPPAANRATGIRLPGSGAVAAPVASIGSARACEVMTASYGGPSALLIRAEAPGRVVFTALGVQQGAENLQAQRYISTHAVGGTVAGRFPNRDDAVLNAYTRCDSGKP